VAPQPKSIFLPLLQYIVTIVVKSSLSAVECFHRRRHYLDVAVGSFLEVAARR